MKELTKAEEQLMHIIWTLKTAYLKDIVEQYPEPRPAYTTIATVVTVLVKKGVVGFKARGKTKEYYPLLTKEDYTQKSVKGLMDNFFDNSVKQFASYFATQDSLTVEELKEIRSLIDEQIAQRKP